MSSMLGIDTLRRAVESWNAGNLLAYLTLYDKDAVLHGYAGVEPGIASIRRFYQAFWAAFAGSRLEIEDLFASADRVACRFVVTAKHSGPFQGMPATGKQFTLPGITILRFSGDRCVERWSQADFLGMFHGAIFFSRFWRRAVERYFIIRWFVIGPDPCSRAA